MSIVHIAWCAQCTVADVHRPHSVMCSMHCGRCAPWKYIDVHREHSLMWTVHCAHREIRLVYFEDQRLLLDIQPSPTQAFPSLSLKHQPCHGGVNQSYHIARQCSIRNSYVRTGVVDRPIPRPRHCWVCLVDFFNSCNSSKTVCWWNLSPKSWTLIRVWRTVKDTLGRLKMPPSPISHWKQTRLYQKPSSVANSISMDKLGSVCSLAFIIFSNVNEVWRGGLIWLRCLWVSW